MTSVETPSAQFLLSLPAGFDVRARTAYASIQQAATLREQTRANPGATAAAVAAPPCAADGGIEERLVTIGEDARLKRGPLLKEAPGSLSEVANDEELRKYTVEALRKLAKAEGLDLGKAPSRERVVQELASLIATSSEVAAQPFSS